MIVLKLSLEKVDPSLLYKGESETFLNCALRGYTDEASEGIITQDVSKEARAKGETGPRIGKWKRIGYSPKPAATKTQPETKTL